ncbi:hypothetical protein EKO23_16340 [Nocardioides guangzhouensis]|uniref:Uncharacterized protein n=1 Tax=Nocardioides guangzhouensis TaxID=2497878 RepID=A0A4V1XYS1_9ACTN|nr:hypothetical protein [Nocardioides guangzhouensis]RYP84229.1 hypothetical protein EKO23_16340 [Nocardioides guangzhouensis]
MSAKRITRPMLERSIHIVDTSGILDILAPPPPPGRRGRKGRIRENIRLWLLGVLLCTRLGHETTVRGVHEVLTEALPRDMQWELGILRPLTTRAPKLPGDYDPETARLTKSRKPRKELWVEEGYERLGYDDLINATTKIRAALDYGHGTQPNLDDAERERRRSLVEDAVHRLITVTVVPRVGTSLAIDGTGQWVWSRGSETGRTKAKKDLKNGKDKLPSEDGSEDLEVADIALDEEGGSAPSDDEERPVPAGARGRCLDAAWGYKTSKTGKREVGFGFHQHTLVRTPDPGMPADAEPLLIEGLVVVPANADVVDASLRLIDRAAERSKVTRLIGDLLYTNLKADRWAVPLAQRGIKQSLAMRSDSAGIVDINGALMQFGWMHCPAAPMDQRPMPADFARDEDKDHYEAVEQFRADWAFDRKESGLGANRSSKWICPAMAGRTGCWARGAAQVAAAQVRELPIVTPPEDWQTRGCCTNKTMDFTPDPTKPHDQRKLMQPEYVGTRRWRRERNLRSLVEGAFGILKSSSRQRMRRGQNRLPGLAMANLINGLKGAVFNEEQLRAWHEETGRGPAHHPLLQPDPHDWGFTDLTREQAKAIDAGYLGTGPGEEVTPLRAA